MSDSPELDEFSSTSALGSLDSTLTVVPDLLESSSTLVYDQTAKYCHHWERLHLLIPVHGLVDATWPMFVVQLCRCWVSVPVLLPVSPY